MAFKEAVFWVGLTMFGTGLYFFFERLDRLRISIAIAFVVIGLVGMAYSVVKNHYPDYHLPSVPRSVWIPTVIVTLLILAVGISRNLSAPVPPPKANAGHGDDLSKPPSGDSPTGQLALARWHLEKDPDHLTLHDLLLADFMGVLMCEEPQELDINSPNGKSAVNIEKCAAFDFDTNTKFLQFYIPNTKETQTICEYIADRVDQFLNEIEHAGFHMNAKSAGESDLNSSRNAVFSRRVFIYHEADLTAAQVGDLTKLYATKTFSLQLRGSDYLAYQQAEAKLKLRPPVQPV